MIEVSQVFLLLGDVYFERIYLLRRFLWS